jgi:hypothetical protein
MITALPSTPAQQSAANLARLFQIAEPERTARLRELRLATLLLCGGEHPATRALGAAVADPAALDGALLELTTIPALRRRRILATIARVIR